VVSAFLEILWTLGSECVVQSGRMMCK